ncbi:ATP-dependent zinc protease [Pseudoluteimonas lycopersici]|uniref:ATP-dependent zinc protease n=1 Tax=Pseudoluteimonas lycopersici TaxID=1324796 RepID=A0A516V511_9GAMM|nr:RimK/LysX family protein [Lysobacter lycopersici]QDQ73613.1 ATP-dependent zinc protease [Lysobacter lycopersici]
MIELGWREWAVLPDLGLPRMRAKIDTGARTSALHVDAHWRFVEAGAPWVGFRVSSGRKRIRTVEAAAPLVDEREVVDSGGHRGLRPFLRTTLWLAGQARPVEINLTDRGSMLFPLLVGRSALGGAFTVDPARSFLHPRPVRA